jgi:hypothetical protein
MAPGVYFNWLDAGISPMAIATSIGGAAFHADRGDLTPTSQTQGYEGFQKTYGVSNYRRSYGHDTARAFYRTAQAGVWVRSPGQNAVYANAILANNFVYKGASLVREGSSVTPLTGSLVDYTQTNQDAWDLIFSNEVPVNASVTLTINEITTTPVMSNGNQIAFMVALAASINAALGAIATNESINPIGAVAVPVSRVTSSPVTPSDPATTPRIIRIVGPQNITLAITNVTFTGLGAGLVSAIAQPTEWLAYVMAQNPGGWGNNNALQFTQLSLGTNSTIQIMLTGAADPLNGFAATINGINIVVPPNTAGNNALLTDIADAITAQVPNVVGVVQAASGINNDRILVLAATNSSFTIHIAAAILVQHAALLPPPYINITTLITPYVPPTDFVMNVYEYPNLRTIIGSYSATFAETIDATGNPTNLAMQVNSGAAGAAQSQNIRLYMNPLVATEGLTLQSSTLLNYFTKDGMLGGGADGLLSTSADIINAWNQLSDPTQWTVRILMNCGYATIAVQQAINMLCMSRRDCVSILDMAPSHQTNDTSTVNARNSMNINSSYSALYTPNIKIYDLDLNIYRSSPPSGYVGAIYALTDMTRAEWWSPAGLNRGNIPEAEGLDVVYSAGMISAMAAAQINPIINYKNQSIVVWGDWTLQYANSPLQFVGTRRMCNTIEIIATMTVAYSLFEPNTKSTRNHVILVSNQILQPIKDGQGINRFLVVDLTQSYHVDNRQAYFRYIIDPVTSIHQILIDGIITRNNASFAEYTVIAANSNTPVSAQASA